ncbi:MAG: P pilus assembly/Cpx signaling pathway, periplasmic inhibitor/zinc-resistance associated protein [Solidesulfovibrio magneticus str. Maddingley MBC34]|uniref:P pilus assembly/Cpx signaling pathway, periplasmic inhibitor/zinc-resistance associated protein n=1 Tax=Solidesulfovibrio magneticus str. Maddingley MBC34 TaxID=1206767 RepID=K6GR35_9BACT|nr:MAG: P pilus assembly/Cpx signaling pathway, periplasmic inhibitor/zinc-resistance associated protein [Solidesulfovibrio magneticus str. Maddingley MBC34]
MKKLFYGLLTLTILVGSAYAVAAGPGPGGPGGPGPEGLLDRLLSLKLTDAQKHDVAVVFKNNRQAFDAGMAAMRQAFDAMGLVMRTEPGNEERVRQASRAVAAAGEDLAVLRGKVEAAVLTLLTPEQRKLWEETMPPRPPREAKERFHAGHELVNEWIDSHAGKNS